MIGLWFNFDYAKSMSLRKGLFLKCLIISESLKLHSHKILPPNILKSFSYKFFERLLFSDCKNRLIQLAFSDHMNFSMSIILNPP